MLSMNKITESSGLFFEKLERFSTKHINPRSKERRSLIKDFLIYSTVMAVCTLIGLLFRRLGFSDATIITVYILGVLISAVLVTSYISNIVVSFEAMIVFNFFFTEPLFTLHAYDAEYPVTFVVMLIVSFISCTIAARLKTIAVQSDAMRARTKLLFDTASQLHKMSEYDEILGTTCGQLTKLIGRPMLLYDRNKGLEKCFFFSSDALQAQEQETDVKSLPAIKWVSMYNKQAGRGTGMFPANPLRYFPVSSHEYVYAVIGIDLWDEQYEPTDQFDVELIVSILGECSMALEKERIRREKEEEVIRRRNEKLRADLLRSISHDLRTPLTSISGNASNLLSLGNSLDDKTKMQLYSDIYEDSVWLGSLVENLLAVSRIEGGTMNLRIGPELIDDIISEALQHIDRRGSEYTIVAEPSPETLLVDVDGRLIVQVLINLINNAIQYTPAGSTIRISTDRLSALREDGSVKIGPVRNEECIVVTVADNGPGIPDSEKTQVFTMFYSGRKQVTDSKRSLGLGLALCRSIIRAHGCEIWLTDSEPHGARFMFTLPLSRNNYH